MKTSHRPLKAASVLFLAGMLTVTTTWSAETPPDDNRVIDLKPLAKSGMNVEVKTPSKLPIYVNRQAARVLDVLPPGQVVHLLAMDRYGLQIQGRGKNGQITGWIGQRHLFGKDEEQQARLRDFYDRQLKIEKLVAEKRPAIGMDLGELRRILGEPTNQQVGAGPDGRSETVTWVINKKVDLNEILAVGTDEEILKVDVETGRVEVAMNRGLASAIKMNVDGAGVQIPTVAPPVRSPFGPKPKEILAGN